MGSFPTTVSSVCVNTEDEAALRTALSQAECDVLVIPMAQTESAAKSDDDADESANDDKNTVRDSWLIEPSWSPLDGLTQGALAACLVDEKFTAAHKKCRVWHVPTSLGMKARWVVMLGVGKLDKLTVAKWESALQAAMKAVFGFDKANRLAVLVPNQYGKVDSPELLLRAIVNAAFQATYKTQEAGEKKCPKLKQLLLLLPNALKKATDVLPLAENLAKSQSWTKDLANMPANLKMAETLAEAARSLKGIKGVTVTVIDDVDEIRTTMPAFWAVAQASATSDPPRFIRLQYQPSGKSKKHIALVGKGVIFDTGGVQVKPGNFMNDMKFDMTGAATVLSVFKALAELQLPDMAFSAYVAATRNAISDTAYLPDSIIDSASGKKIEIRHTDAEGRVTLADAVHKATLDNPDELITIATLTGAAGVAVGHCIALMGTDDDMVNRMTQAAKRVGDPVQPFELLDDDYDAVKSDRDAADLSNTSKIKGRGHLTAGAFVLTFAKSIPAIHLDIRIIPA